MKKYTFSKMSIFGIVILFAGVLMTLQGIANKYYLSNVNVSCQKAEIKNGRYIERDLTKDQLIGKYYTEKSGTVKYGPYCEENALSSVQTYVASVNEDCNYYVPLIIPREYQKDFKEMLNGDVAFHILGKFVKSDYILNYDIITACTGMDSKTEIDQMISTEYQIEMISLKDEKKILYKGLSLFILGVLTLFFSVSHHS